MAADRSTAAAQDARTEQGASAEARRTGAPVEVTGLRTETQEVVANPSGTFTLTQYAQPVRARKNGQLVPVDANLLRVGDRIAPKATTLDVTISPGGDTTLATLTEQGRRLSIQWPKPLPVPALEANEATYPEVFPGVDLKVRATTETIAQVLVVKNAEAAKNSELQRLQLGLETEGLRLDVNETLGTVRALNPAGQELFTSSTPRMWDSSVRPEDQRSAAAPAAGPATAPRPASSGSTGSLASGDLEPGVKHANVGLSYADGKLILTPDQSVLNGKDTTYPVYIDPKFGGKRQAWAIAYKPAPNSSFWNGTGWGGKGKSTSEARIGHEGETGGTARSFFRMNSKGLAGTEVINAQFNIVNTHSWSCSARPVEIWDTGSISSATTWNNQPSWTRKIQTLNFAHGNDHVGCSDKGVDFDVTSMAKDAARKGWPDMTVGLRASNESNVYDWKKFSSDPKLIVEYNHAPDNPRDYGSNPSVACAASPTPQVGNTDLQLFAKISDRDGGTLKARFNMWVKDGDPAVFNQTIPVTSGSIAKVSVPKSTLKDGTTYQWQVRADDGRATSSWVPSTPCRFTVDKSRPSTPPVAESKEFPNGDDGAQGAPARTKGTFTLRSGDVKDVVKYVYDFDRKYPTTVAKPTSHGGSVELSFTPPNAGPHILYAYSEDAAGNRSDTGTYLFYASSTGIKNKPGDLNGDGIPDLWAIDGDGKLRMYAGTGDGSFGPMMVAAESGFQDSLITRRGDYSNDGCDDLVARHPDGKLWVYHNTGFGAVDSENRQELRQFIPELRTERISRIVSLGDITGDGAPDLLATVDDTLWFLAGHPGNYIDDAYPLAETGWSGRDLVAPGDITGDGAPDLLVRDNATGQLITHHGALDPETGGIMPASLVNGSTSVYGTAGWQASNRPLLAMPGDASNDGTADLWATTAEGTGTLLFHTTKNGTHGTPVLVGTGGWTGIKAIT
ncbi:FG-GAP-like repeat-containing protein [Streptomyces sp. NPDC050610]|uniref:FG-GAP-like repeat-containing protein n=1 Tax=Streptomyces sp. NPDC050610 TaxID=3157097 RepID=UPI0034165525